MIISFFIYYGIVLLLTDFSVLQTMTAETRCRYSFVINEVDPTTCPCLVEKLSESGDGHSLENDRHGNAENPNHYISHMQKDEQATESMNKEPDFPQHYQEIKEELKETIRKKELIGSDRFKYDFTRLKSTMKDLEIKVYQESVKNRELKNIVIKQEQSVKDYKFLVEKLKETMTEQKVALIKEKDNLMDEIIYLKRSMDVMKETLHKQDYFLKTLEKNTFDLKKRMNPDRFHRDKSIGGSKVKVIPVQSTSQVTCDGLSINATKYKDCDELYQRGHTISGVYYIKPSFTPCSIPVYCDMSTNDTGWILLQRRYDGSLIFNRNWDEYRDGFGNLNREFWLGNNNIFLLTNQASYRLRIDMWDFNNTHKFAEYLYFTVAGERDKYRLFVLNHTGTVNDGLVRHNGMMFSTRDEDNDSWQDYHCAKQWGGGWWYSNCWFVILNGRYYHTPKVKYRGISWNEWKTEQLKKVEMKISPSDYR